MTSPSAPYPAAAPFQWVAVQDLQPDMQVDLEGDPYLSTCSDDECDSCASMLIQVQSEYLPVAAVDQETPACVRVDFDTASIGFPTGHKVRVYNILSDGTIA